MVKSKARNDVVHGFHILFDVSYFNLLFNLILQLLHRAARFTIYSDLFYYLLQESEVGIRRRLLILVRTSATLGTPRQTESTGTILRTVEPVESLLWHDNWRGWDLLLKNLKSWAIIMHSKHTSPFLIGLNSSAYSFQIATIIKFGRL